MENACRSRTLGRSGHLPVFGKLAGNSDTRGYGSHLFAGDICRALAARFFDQPADASGDGSRHRVSR